jgi:hypothetical protein
MKKIDKIRTSLLLIITAASVAGCNSEEESPFSGKDNSIVAFTLVKDGVTLKGAVSPETIVITAPERFSLSGAKASVTVSENATVEPDPSTITDWDVTNTFTVTSYNGTKNTYAYSVERHLVSRDGDVILLTQADVEAFAAEFDADQINGSITVGSDSGKDTVTSLTGLERLKVITGNIIINSTYMGDVTVFENLEKVDGLKISTNVKTVRFPNLSVIHSSLTFQEEWNSTATKTLDFPELKVIDKDLLISTDSLETMNFPKLQKVTGNITAQGRGYGLNLSSIDFPELQKAGGDVHIYKCKQLEHFSAPKLETVSGNFTVEECPLLADVNCLSLKTVGGNISLFPLSNVLTSLQFPALTSAENLMIDNAPNLTSLRFPALKYIKDAMSLGGMNLVSLEAFNALDSVGGQLYLSNLPNLSSLRLSSLKKINMLYVYQLNNIAEIDLRGIKVNSLELYGTVRSDFTLIGDDDFPGQILFNLSSTDISVPLTVRGFKNVGNIIFSAAEPADFPWLENVTGLLNMPAGRSAKVISLPNLKSAGGIQIGVFSDLETLNLPKLETITGYTDTRGSVTGFSYSLSSPALSVLELPALKSVTGNITVSGLNSNSYYSYKLSDIRFPALESLVGTLSITGSNYALFTDLSGFDKLKSVGGITISGFPELKDFEPLKNVIPLENPVFWKISGCGYNPSHQDMIDGKYVQP